MSDPQPELRSTWSVTKTVTIFVTKTPGTPKVETWTPWVPDACNTSKGFIVSGQSCSVGPVVLTPGVDQDESPRLFVTGVRKCDEAREDYIPVEGGDGAWGHQVTFIYVGGNNPILCRKCGRGFEDAIGDVPPLRSSDMFEVRHENIRTVELVVVTVELVVTTYLVMLVGTNLDPGYAHLWLSRVKYPVRCAVKNSR